MCTGCAAVVGIGCVGIGITCVLLSVGALVLVGDGVGVVSEVSGEVLSGE